MVRLSGAMNDPKIPESIGGSRGWRFWRRSPAVKTRCGWSAGETGARVSFITCQRIKGHQHHGGLLWCQNARLMLAIEGCVSIRASGDSVPGALCGFAACATGHPPAGQMRPQRPYPFNNRRRDGSATSYSSCLFIVLSPDPVRHAAGRDLPPGW